MKQGTLTRHRANSALRVCTPSEYRPAPRRGDLRSADVLDLRGKGAERRVAIGHALGWPARRPARRRFHARQAAQTTDQEGAPAFAARLRPAPESRACSRRRRRASPRRGGMIDRRVKRFPREAQKPRAFGFAERDAFSFRRFSARNSGGAASQSSENESSGARARRAENAAISAAADRAGGRGFARPWESGRAEAVKRARRCAKMCWPRRAPSSAERRDARARRGACADAAGRKAPRAPERRPIPSRTRRRKRAEEAEAAGRTA